VNDGDDDDDDGGGNGYIDVEENDEPANVQVRLARSISSLITPIAAVNSSTRTPFNSSCAVRAVHRCRLSTICSTVTQNERMLFLDSFFFCSLWCRPALPAFLSLVAGWFVCSLRLI